MAELSLRSTGSQARIHRHVSSPSPLAALALVLGCACGAAGELPADAGFKLDAAFRADARPTPDAAPVPDAEALPDAAATFPDAAPPRDAGPDAGFVVEVIIDDTAVSRSISNGPRGDPRQVGCADGQREGFVDDSQYPNIAGCLGSWSGMLSLRAATSTSACGDDLRPCASPADLCAPGWHICGVSGAVAELQQLTPEQCDEAGGGRYVAALSHCGATSGCVYGPSLPCFPNGYCAEPVCCGAACPDFGACRDAIWPGRTHIPPDLDHGCAALPARKAGGVMCCR